MKALSGGEEKTALVIHPDPASRPGLRTILRGVGFGRVLETGAAAEAMALLRGELVNLVLASWEVPGRSGGEWLKALRHRGQFRPVPVVLLDDGLTPAAIVLAVKAGIAGKIDLPAKAADLRKIVNELGKFTPRQTALAAGASKPTSSP